VVSVTGVSAGQAERYYSEKDNYYTHSSGMWFGRGAEALGLSGDIRKDEFTRLLNGRNRQGQELIAAGTNGERRSGVDLTFSAPKSASILSEVFGDEKVREAHNKAVNATLAYVERNFAQARQTVDGHTERVNTGNLVIATFRHDTSRSLDPALHTHCVVLSATQREDGHWRALSNEELYRNKMLIGQTYRNELAANLREHGYSITANEKGLFEVNGIDKKLLEHYSQRKEQIDTRVQELEESGLYQNANEQKLREIATLGSRVAKKNVEPEIVRKSWNERLMEQGHTKEAIYEGISRASEHAKAAELERQEPKPNEYDYIRMSVKAITEQESVFSKQEVLKVAGRLSVGEHRIADIERGFDELNKDKELLSLQENMYTTKEMLSVEASIIRKAERGQDKMEPLMPEEQADKEIRGYKERNNISLTAGQEGAAYYILHNQDRIIGIKGYAGTGKTTMLHAVRDIVERHNEQSPDSQYELKGLSFTGKSAEEIEKNAGISSQTLHSFLAKEPEQSGKRQIWVVDEASMVGSKQAWELIKLAQREDARIVMLGDNKQLQAISAGGIFRKLSESGAMRTVEMTEIVRQKTQHMKDVVGAIKDRKIDKAFETLNRKGRLHEITDREERIQALVKDYTGKIDYRDTLIVTALNQDRRDINDSVRQELKVQGRLTGKECTYAIRENKTSSPTEKHFAQSYKEGDIITANGPIKGIQTGQEAKIVSTDVVNHHIGVRFADKKGRTRELDIDIKRDSGKLAVYQERDAGFMKGDKVVFLKNDNKLHVQNGLTGDIIALNTDGDIKVKTDTGRNITLNINSDYQYLSHGYCVTDHKSQGQTAKAVFVHADTSTGMADERNSFNSFYVAVTRGREDVKVYTDNADSLLEQVKNLQVKQTALDYADNANSLGISKEIVQNKTVKDEIEYRGSGGDSERMNYHLDERSESRDISHDK
jgi:conjugative relaxase-like TrwC/TraI family protein